MKNVIESKVRGIKKLSLKYKVELHKVLGQSLVLASVVRSPLDTHYPLPLYRKHV